MVAEAQSDASIQALDLAIADEAHRCTGKVSSDFSTVLDSKRLRATKRLFATATPRTYTASVKKSAEDRGIEVVGMDDEVIFGKVLYSLPFGEAIRRNLLTDYRIVIIGVDNPMIAEWIKNRELIKTDSGIENDAEAIAAQIGLLKAIKDYDLKRVISFHSRVSRAESFKNDVHQVRNWIDEEHRLSGELWTDFVSGTMATDKRRQKLDYLKGLGQNQRGLLTNARCLSEGVDVPSLDGVAFIHPKSSQVDIVQAVGRAIRLSDEKKFGTIVLPVFIEQGDNAAASIEASHFKPVWDVLNAFKSHDEELSHQLDTLRTKLGRKPGSKIKPLDLSKITIDLPASVDGSFGDSLRTYLVEQSTASWHFWYGLLLDYVEEHRHARVPRMFKYENYSLGRWIGTQRLSKNKLDVKRIQLLEELPQWSWGVFEEQWSEGFEYLKKYVAEHGHAGISTQAKYQNFNLGTWANCQRIKKDSLDLKKIKLLEELPQWSWNPLEERWNEGFENLKNILKNTVMPEYLPN
ncbi:MAG: Helicase associated domain protein [Methylococcales bacterium]|nr:Helicase associated domain protein [Methylococcales bacterium]